MVGLGECMNFTITITTLKYHNFPIMCIQSCKNMTNTILIIFCALLYRSSEIIQHEKVH